MLVVFSGSFNIILLLLSLLFCFLKKRMGHSYNHFVSGLKLYKKNQEQLPRSKSLNSSRKIISGTYIIAPEKKFQSLKLIS